MKTYILSVACLLLLAGCDAITDMKGMFEKQEAVHDLVMEKYGWESQVGFNINNGVLTQVTLVLNANDVRDEKVSRLEKIARLVIAESFASKPNVIYIQIASLPDDNL
ncbi:MAG: hypothetical protein DRQ59_04660 [Gammaproteobacteria bacterium]|nr:MAG: hypothetical protein DRQ59_04660 [Gammaproteobacteria bacterium]